MKWNQAIQRVIDYVEEHLQRIQEDINIHDIENMMECSFTLFQKMFSYQFGIGFSEYVRNRKMTLAGYDLKSTQLKVIDISYKYGYDSPTSFTKAFQSFHGMTPSAARQPDTILNVYPKMNIHVQKSFPWRIEHHENFIVIGKSILIHENQDQENREKIPAFWSQCFQDGTYAQLIQLDQAQKKGCFGIFYNDGLSQGQMKYMIGVLSLDKQDGWESFVFPETSWAIFECRGRLPQSIHDGWNYLNQEWLVQYPFRHRQCPDLEWYAQGNAFSEDYLSEIWIAIEKGEE